MRKLLLLLSLLASNAVAADVVTVLKAARLIDGTGGPVVGPAMIVVTGKTITSVGTAIAIPSGATVIDLGNSTLLPGFIDAHTHLIGRTLGEEGWDQSSVKDLDGYGAIRGVPNSPLAPRPRLAVSLDVICRPLRGL